MVKIQTLPRVPIWTLRDRIIKARTEAGLTQAEFAQRARIGHRTIARWENMPQPPSRAAAVYAGVTGYPLWWFEGEGHPEPDAEASEGADMPTYAYLSPVELRRVA